MFSPPAQRGPLSSSPDTLARAVEDARRILQEHIELGSLDATRALEQVVVVLDRADVLFALGRVKRRRLMPLVDARRGRAARLPHLPAPGVATALNEHASSELPEHPM